MRRIVRECRPTWISLSDVLMAWKSLTSAHAGADHAARIEEMGDEQAQRRTDRLFLPALHEKLSPDARIDKGAAS